MDIKIEGSLDDGTKDQRKSPFSDKINIMAIINHVLPTSSGNMHIECPLGLLLMTVKQAYKRKSSNTSLNRGFLMNNSRNELQTQACRRLSASDRLGSI